MKKKKKLSLPVQIFIALVLGIVVGLVFYFTGAAGFTTSYIKPFGDIFVNLLKFIVVPVVLLSMIDGIISMGDMKKVGAVGWKTILYFMVTTAVACVIGLVLATVFNNAGLFPNLSEAAQAAEYEAKEYAHQHVEGVYRSQYASGHRHCPAVRRLHSGCRREVQAGPGHGDLRLCRG